MLLELCLSTREVELVCLPEIPEVCVSTRIGDEVLVRIRPAFAVLLLAVLASLAEVCNDNATLAQLERLGRKVEDALLLAVPEGPVQ